MKKITFLFTFLAISLGYAQDSLPYNFGTVAAPTTHGIVPDPADPTPVVTNEVDPDDANNSVLQIVGGGTEWDNAQVTFATPIDLSDNENNVIRFRFKDMTGTEERTHALKFEGGVGGPAATELTFKVTGNAWQTIDLDFPGGLGTFAKMVIFTDFGVVGPTGTYLIDDMEQTSAPCVSPVLSTTAIDFSDPEDALFIGDSGATVSVVTDPGDAGNQVLQMVGNGSEWDNAQVTFCDPVDLSDDANNTVRFRMRSTTAAAGTNEHLLKFELPTSGGDTELIFTTSGQDWTDVEVNFGPGLASYGKMVIMGDWANAATNMNSAGQTNTYIIDDMTLGATNLGVEDFRLVEFKAYPNPTQDSWTVKSKNQLISTINVYDILGKQVLTMAPNSSETIINGSNLKSGIYFAQIKTGNSSSSVKLIKQ